MPRASGDRFSSQNLADCAYCPPGGRQFRTARQCGGCSRPLCLVCRPEIPGSPFLCPDCGGGAREDTLRQPAATIARLQEGGVTTPFWLTVLHARLETAPDPDADELLVPE